MLSHTRGISSAIPSPKNASPHTTLCHLLFLPGLGFVFKITIWICDLMGLTGKGKILFLYPSLKQPLEEIISQTKDNFQQNFSQFLADFWRSHSHLGLKSDSEFCSGTPNAICITKDTFILGMLKDVYRYQFFRPLLVLRILKESSPMPI